MTHPTAKQATHEAAMKAARKALLDAPDHTDWHGAMCRAYHAHLVPLVFAAGAQAMKERCALIAEYARMDTGIKIRRATEDNHTSELYHQEGRWHAANDIESAIRALPLPTTEGK